MLAIIPCAVQYILVAYLFYTKKFAPYLYLAPPLFPLPTDNHYCSLFYVLRVCFCCVHSFFFYFQASHINDNIQYLSFSVLYYYTNLISSTSIYNVENGKISFSLWLGGIALCVCARVCVSYLLHSSVDGCSCLLLYIGYCK